MDSRFLARPDYNDNLLSLSGTSGRIIILVFIFLIPSSLFSQRKADIGFFAGTSYYMGDINPGRFLYSPGIAIGPIYRYNLNLRNSIRMSGIYHILQAKDRDFTDPFQILRNASFRASFADVAAIFEFNFLPYKTTHRKFNHSVYLSGGMGYHFVVSSNVASKNHFTIPFGIGYKLNVSKKMAAGAELSVRKTFTDKIDGVTNFPSGQNKDLFGNNDWYTFAGIFITYKIFNFREDCPAYNTKENKSHGNN
jgi:hypothetical protein